MSRFVGTEAIDFLLNVIHLFVGIFLDNSRQRFSYNSNYDDRIFIVFLEIYVNNFFNTTEFSLVKLIFDFRLVWKFETLWNWLRSWWRWTFLDIMGWLKQLGLHEIFLGRHVLFKLNEKWYFRNCVWFGGFGRWKICECNLWNLCYV